MTIAENEIEQKIAEILKRLDDIDQRIDQMDKKIDGLAEGAGRLFMQIGKKLEL